MNFPQGILIKMVGILLVVVALIGTGVYLRQSGYNSGYTTAEQKGQLELAQYKASQQDAHDKIAAENRKTEEALQTRILEGIAEKEREILAINDHHQRIIDGLRIRPSRNADSVTTKSAPAATAPVECPRTVCSGKELSREDGEFLAGEAASADTLRQSVLQCRRSFKDMVDSQNK